MTDAEENGGIATYEPRTRFRSFGLSGGPRETWQAFGRELCGVRRPAHNGARNGSWSTATGPVTLQYGRQRVGARRARRPRKFSGRAGGGGHPPRFCETKPMVFWKLMCGLCRMPTVYGTTTAEKRIGFVWLRSGVLARVFAPIGWVSGGGICKTNPMLCKPAWESYQNEAKNEPNLRTEAIGLQRSPKRLVSNSIWRCREATFGVFKGRFGRSAAL